MDDDKPYVLKISRKTIDKLGVKLYDRVALVISELVSNSYDADAKVVTVRAPAAEFLATRKGGKVEDKGYEIRVEDNGFGMNPDQLNNYYLVVGSDRRTDARGEISPSGRAVMGRKGVGKLAPFGICKTIEIISAGEDPSVIPPEPSRPYHISHVILNYDKITELDDYDYLPDRGDQDRQFTDKRGTTIILRDFLTRRVPEVDTLSEQIAQRFGNLLDELNFKVSLIDNVGAPLVEHVVKPMDLPRMPSTRFNFSGPEPTIARDDDDEYSASHELGEPTPLKAGFWFEGKFYPIVGWVGYSKAPVKHDIAAGIRIYCRKKFAAQTLTFEMASGFHGEYQVKSYLIGELYCDWLDEEEDLIHTDRQNIQWSSDVGTGFKTWGQAVIREIGRTARRPAGDNTLDLFNKTVDLAVELDRRFPEKDQDDVRKRARNIVETLARKMDPEEASDPEAAKDVLTLATAFAPHMALSDELSNAADTNEKLNIGTVAAILSRAKLAESMTLGAIAEKRLRIIEQFRGLVHANPASDEGALQKILEEAPWLVRPEWTPISENKSLRKVRDSLERFLSDRLGAAVILSAVAHPTKRPDFVLLGIQGPLQIVEIKKPLHEFDATDFTRLLRYVDAFDEFFADESNKTALADVKSYKITLVADGVNLNQRDKLAFEQLKSQDKLELIKWDVVLDHSKMVHQDFLDGLEEAGLTLRADA